MHIEPLTDLAIRGSSRPQAAGVPPLAPLREVFPAGELVAEPHSSSADDSRMGEHETEQAVERMNAFLRSGDSHIQFALHEKSKQMMVEVINNETQEVVRTFPPKELLDLAAKIGDMVGALVDKKT